MTHIIVIIVYIIIFLSFGLISGLVEAITLSLIVSSSFMNRKEAVLYINIWEGWGVLKKSF
jgi:hypothetical protein